MRAARNLGLLLFTALPALATTPALGQSAGGSTSASSMPAAGQDDPEAPTGGDGPTVKRAGGGITRTRIQPYIEVRQNFIKELRPGDDTVTYTALAAGADMQFGGRYTQGSLSVRYERRFVEKGNFNDGDSISGLARIQRDLIPRTLRIEAGALASRTRVDSTGSALVNGGRFTDSVTQVYAVYGGPTYSSRIGDVKVNAGYTAGYTKVDNKDALQLVPNGPRTDIFDHSFTQNAQVSAGVRPGEVLPVGVTASGGFTQEDISNLDQRIRSLRAGVQVTLPVTLSLALVGDVGWEHAQVSSRDAVRDADGNPVLGSNGHYLVDKSKPRQIAYDSEGLTWDVGVIWRPSRRTSLSAFIGRRYDSTTYYGSFSYNPNPRHALQVSVYDGISGFGSSLGNQLQSLPTDFNGSLDPVGGGLTGCGFGATGGTCLNGPFGSLSSAAFRGRGVNASYVLTLQRLQFTLGAGYANRRFIGAPGTVLGIVNGTVSENWYVTMGLGGPIDARSNFGVNVYSAWFRNRQNRLGDSNAVGASASYYRQLTDRLVASAALGLDAVNYNVIEDQLILSGQLGLRYNF
ncbi:preprotein translocase subunit YajC [Novosphingobium olei]|uniref:Preprotein translocase subunit YajC n=1 Tax=Novosphingobium olei TaxID=2728851 RepID=A0A7Y0BNP1_9SPHN|nr:preprotein translocase subunit YajC [Novosphingobium olei]NML93694.1 preprotein translocase subunit YajC [Novosphingobium olei]